jgi:hypothetical protein
MLRGDEHGGGGYSYGGDSPQQSPRRSEDQGAVWRSCYEYAVVTSRLKRVEAEGHSGQDEDVEALWRKRAELAKGIVDAAAPTIQDVLMKVAMTASLLSEGELSVGLTPQCLEECDRALAHEGEGGAMPQSSGAGAMGIVPAGPGANCRARGAMGLCR